MSDPLEHRKIAARMANQARESGSDWFESFYQWTGGELEKVPWADLTHHPLLDEWLSGKSLGSVAVVGCGLGDDAEAIAAHTNSVWAFDVSKTAVQWAKQRYPETRVDYEVADLFNLPEARVGAFSAVIEIYTLQALPPERRRVAFAALVSLLLPKGELVVITRWRSPESELGPVPWPLLMTEFDEIDALGLERIEQTEAEEGQAIRLVWRKN